MEFFSSDYLRPADMPGHFSYILLAVSYILTNIFWLRVMAIAALAFEIVYFYYSGGDLRTGMVWDMIFIAINLFQLFLLTRERYLFSIPEPDRTFLKAAMPGLSQANLQMLVRAGRLSTIESGKVIARENQRLDHIYLICDGQAKVSLDGTDLATIGGGSFVGEAAFLTDGIATATVTSGRSIRALVFSCQKLRSLIAKDGEIAKSMHELLGRDLVRKMRASNDSKRVASLFLNSAS